MTELDVNSTLATKWPMSSLYRQLKQAQQIARNRTA